MTKRKIELFLTLGMLIFLTFSSYDCLSQDTTTTQKILLLEKTTLKSGQTKPSQKIFYINNKIVVRRYSNTKVLRGRIDSINDSTIIVKGKSIDIKDIKIINKNKGEAIIRVGEVATIISIGMPIIGYIEFNNNSKMDGFTYGVISAMVTILITVPVLVIGFIDRVTEKHYHLDKNYKLIVK
jgi:hypothetical protein